MRPRLLRVHPADNVAVALEPLRAGEPVTVDGMELRIVTEVPAGHKVALSPLARGAAVLKYGAAIGATVVPVVAGEWVHTHNLRTQLQGRERYGYRPAGRSRAVPASGGTFLGYLRADGRVGTRNEIWILNTVACVNPTSERIARLAGERHGGRVDGIHAFTHPYGCSQLGDDLSNTQGLLAGLLRHPNAGGVLVLGLGCENNQIRELIGRARDRDPARVRYFNSQDVGDELEAGLAAVDELVDVLAVDQRVERPVSDLLIGVKCGGSDGFSGISANPLVGRVVDRLVGAGGGTVLTEVPEMFGAEQLLMARAADEQVFDAIVRMIDDFKAYFERHGQPIYENPSPGNKEGGITTLEEKSLGAIQKGGSAPVSAVVRYADRAPGHGLTLVEAPGNDGVSSTALVASGATVLLFTTGRGTPLGFPVPTLKIASNSEIAAKKPHWIDFDAGALLAGTAGMDALAEALYRQLLDVASGRVQTRNEVHGYREIAIWKEGVTL
jgi:altronate hydrolase